MRTAKNSDEAMLLTQESNLKPYGPEPYAYIQWKGTDVCMDAFCVCGNHMHFDCDHAYHIQCDECEAMYYCNPYIELIKLESIEDEYRATLKRDEEEDDDSSAKK